MNRDYDFDVVVAGGGPAGSSTANFLRQRKRSVLVLEREKFPRFHIGESMLPFSNDVWRELGVFEKIDATLHPQAGRQVHPRRVGRRVHLLLRQGDPRRQSLRLPGQARRLRQDAARPRRLARRRGARRDPRRGRRLRRRRRDRARHRQPTASRTACARPSSSTPPAATRSSPAAASSRWSTAKSPPTSPSTRCTRTSTARRAPIEGNIIIGLFDGGWWWMIPFNDGDTSVGIVFEKSYTKAQPRAVVAGDDGSGDRQAAAPQAVT